MTRTRVVVSVAVWTLVWLTLWLSDADPSVIALGGVGVVVATSGFAALDLARTVRAVRWPVHHRTPTGTSGRAAPVPRSLRGAEALLGSPPADLHRGLVAIVDERLRRHHGLDRRDAPDAADALLTPTLLRFVREVPRRAPNERELWALLDEIEAL